MPCRDATLLIEKRLDDKMVFYEKLALRFHLSFCDGCNKYAKQSRILHALLTKSSITDITDFSKLRLADDAKIRIKQSVQNNLDNI
ncbi:MAG: hypothetical protein M0D57_06395 [Sphingobacteriales bacterium JAD_PAG50586_3]|nr:MAG: hypothetical protein M0D57_06395 [Sphingobacteriales bacterium JAD_PAG50586_3]